MVGPPGPRPAPPLINSRKGRMNTRTIAIVAFVIAVVVLIILLT